MHLASALFSARAEPHEDLVTAALMHSLNRGIPGAALVYGWQHWLVVYGYTYDGSNACTAAGNKLNGVYIRDPRVPRSVHYVTCTTWRDNYLRSVPCGMYQGTYVVISGSGSMKVTPQPPAASPTRASDGLVDPDDAMREAQRTAEDLLTLQSSLWTSGLAPAQVRPPALVQRLDHDDSYYYIVPFGRGSRDTARLIIDAHSNMFTEATGVETADESLPAFVHPGGFLERMSGRALDLPGVRPRVVRLGTVGIHPVLVWKPCYQSTTPFLPFYQYSVGDQLVYLRVDGERFDRLTTGPA